MVGSYDARIGMTEEGRGQREKSFWSREFRRGGWKEVICRTWSRRKASAWEPVKLQVSHRVFIISFFK